MATISKYQTGGGATLFEVRYRTPDRHTTRKRGFKTLRDAKAFAATLETSKLKGEFVAASTGRTTIGELGPAWLQRQRAHTKCTTFQSLDSHWRTHVEPRWASVRIADVRYTDVAAWVAGMSTDCGPGTIRIAHQVLRRVLERCGARPDAGVQPSPRRQAAATAAAAQRLPVR